MNMLMTHFHFMQPNWLWLLLLVPPLAWAMLRRSPEVRVLSRLADPALLPYLLDGTPRASRLPAWAVATAASLAILALAGPAWNHASAMSCPTASAAHATRCASCTRRTVTA
jgi:Ca-activated chloride channel family protein